MSAKSKNAGSDYERRKAGRSLRWQKAMWHNFSVKLGPNCAEHLLFVRFLDSESIVLEASALFAVFYLLSSLYFATSHWDAWRWPSFHPLFDADSIYPWTSSKYFFTPSSQDHCLVRGRRFSRKFCKTFLSWSRLPKALDVCSMLPSHWSSDFSYMRLPGNIGREELTSTIKEALLKAFWETFSSWLLRAVERAEFECSTK